MGASDNAAGCAVVLEALRWFRSYLPDCTVRFVWFTGEELDWQGSKEFVRRIRQHKRARFFISSDGRFKRGTGPAWIRVSPEPLKAWAKWLQEAIAIKVGPSDGNDEDAFQARGISTFRVAPRHLAHLPPDRPDGIDSNKLALRGLPSRPLPLPPAPRQIPFFRGPEVAGSALHRIGEREAIIGARFVNVRALITLPLSYKGVDH